MKRASLILLLMVSVVIANAQEPELNFGKKRNNSKKTEQVQQTPSSHEAVSSDGDGNPSLNFGNANANSDASKLIQKVVDNSFLVVRASYNVRDRESGSNVTGTDFFSTVYCMAPLLSYGFGVDNRFLNPWKVDPKYDAGKYGDDLVSVDKLEFKKAGDTGFNPYTLSKVTGEKLAPGFFHVTDSTFQNRGLRVELGNGVKSGYMVWFYVDSVNGETRYNVVPANITFNENSIFSVRQPNDPETVIGGAFLNLNADEPGCLRLNLMGIARLDPYGSGKWELVKMQSKPKHPVKAKPSEPAKETAEPASAPEDESIIPDQSKSKASGKDKKKKGGREEAKSKDSAESSKKSGNDSAVTSGGKSNTSSKKN